MHTYYFSTTNNHRMINRKIHFLFLKDFIYLFLERGERRKKERGRNINQLPLAHPHLGAWPTTEACALVRNQTSAPLVRSPALNPLSHTSQDWKFVFFASNKKIQFSFIRRLLKMFPFEFTRKEKYVPNCK